MKTELTVGNIRIAYTDANHNAFTDLCSFRGRYYLTFRTCPDGHMLFTTSRVIVLASDDGSSWTEVFSFSVEQRDVRDPHFLVFGEKLFVYSGTWLVDPTDSRRTEMNDQLGYAVWSSDGIHWNGPKALDGTHGYYIWRAAALGETAYLVGRRIRDFATDVSPELEREITEAVLMKSTDGLSFSDAGFFSRTYGDETAFLFEPDGSILAIARNYAVGGNAHILRAAPPYSEWERHELPCQIGGPMLAKWGDRYIVGGRKKIGDTAPVTALWWLEENDLHEIAELPSGGDTSYPGFVAIDDTNALLSYYSSHEGSGTSLAPSSIYLAELRRD
ncbi:MAG: hypothetical protein EA426_15830 [Spirochaetaceae bacterium]|nr:MAG: hypothetical protein EA426_15830 [Spirochaetaceae bacterium]